MIIDIHCVERGVAYDYKNSLLHFENISIGLV